MAQLYLIQKLKGLFGNFSNPGVGTAAASDDFDVPAEIAQLNKKVLVHRSIFNTATPATQTEYVACLNGKIKVLAAKLIPHGNFTASTANCFAYDVLEGTDSIVTAITTSTATFTAGTPVDFTMGTDTEIAADALIALKRTETGTVAATDDIQVTLVLEYEEAQ